MCFINISDIVIQILGVGKCQWNEQRRSYHGDEVYFKNEIKISEPAQGKKKNHIIKSVFFPTFLVNYNLP